jgi:hypothetical protein
MGKLLSLLFIYDRTRKNTPPSFSSPVREGRNCFRSIRNQRKGSEPIRAETRRYDISAMTCTSAQTLSKVEIEQPATCNLNSGRPLSTLQSAIPASPKDRDPNRVILFRRNISLLLRNLARPLMTASRPPFPGGWSSIDLTPDELSLRK